MAIAKIDAEGRLPIPTEIRHELGIEAGDAMLLTIDPESGALLLKKIDNPLDGLAAYAIREYRAGRTKSLRDYAAERNIGLPDSE